MEKELDSRTLVRIKAMKVLYNAEFNDISINDSFIDFNKNMDDEPLTKAKDINNLNELITYLNDHIESIDNLISKSLVGYTISRLNLVDLAIVRIATAELLMKKLDKKIIINEALEITKMYTDQGDHKAVSFNNKLLDNICKNLG